MRVFYSLFLFLCLCCSYANADSTTDSSTAGGADIVSGVVCNIVLTLSGPISQAIATLVIIITGYSFFVGKVSIGMLFIVSAGIMFVFGAQTIIGWVLGKNFECVRSTVISK